MKSGSLQQLHTALESQGMNIHDRKLAMVSLAILYRTKKQRMNIHEISGYEYS